MSSTIVIGAGISGLSFAHFSKKPCIVLEKEETAGGLCRSVIQNGFTFDASGHFLHLHHGWTERLVRKLLDDNLAAIRRNSAIFTNRTFVPYPFQANLYHLPTKIKKECLLSFIERPSPVNADANFLQWSHATFGSGITRHFMQPYNEKLWTVSARRLTADWTAPFVPKPSLADLIEGALTDRTKQFGYNTRFFYPAHGGIQALVNALGRKKNIRYNTNVRAINIKNKYVETNAGDRLHFDTLVSTQPLYQLLDSINGLPAAITTAREKLDWNSVTCINLGVRRATRAPVAGGRHWVYFPEKEYPFYRAGVYSNILPSLAPRGCASFYIETSRRPGKRASLEELYERARKGLLKCGFLGAADRIETIQFADIPCAYVIYDKHRAAAVETIQKFLAAHNIHSIGRYGAWKYSFMEESITNAATLADREGQDEGEIVGILNNPSP
ncbi:MAG: hypothetical protein A2219_00655 [Elusimicrobia bacterium RIFOXYA2_FULL_50_26]|nr:MAG: hypothetical protein A2219_00655 [Elusimicrobia bacterium RIFOXYA2_FULL_50_26]